MRRVVSASQAITLCVALLTLGLITSTFAATPARPLHPLHPTSSVPSRITQAIDENNLVTLPRNTRPEASPANDRGPLPDAFDVDHMLLLLQRSPEQEKELERFIDSLNDRNSPNFHKWLSAEEFGERFGVSPDDINTVTGWLQSQGFRVNQVYTSGMLIDFSGPAASLRKGFHTDLHNLQVKGESHIANMNDPMIPAALAPVVKGIASLNDFRPHASYKPKPNYTFAACASDASSPTEPGTCYAVTPQDDAVIYNLNALWSNGITGAGQTIAVVEDTDTYNGSADWTTYTTTFGLSGYGGTYTQVHPGGCADPGATADDGEAAIDVEMAATFAPGAAIENIACPSGTLTFGGQIALANLLNAAGPYPGVVSVSYGVCEAVNGNGGNQLFYNTYQQAAAQGVTVFGATGDEGSAGCGNEFGLDYTLTSLGVSGWTETPYNVAVGGTDFEDVYNAKIANSAEGGSTIPLSTYWSASNSATFGSALSYVPEMPWNDSCADTLISEYVTGSFQTYGSGHICNTSPYDTTASYISLGAASGGASNCATGAAGLTTYEYLISQPECQGWPKPSYQTGATLSGGKAVYGQPSDGARDIPDVSLFAANGSWGHFQTVCWSDPSQTSGGAATCTAGNPSAWSGFGGTSVASPSMAGIQALVNQKTGQNWGIGALTNYYQIGQNEYGTAGGSFLGSGCNSSGAGGPGSGCTFNDVTQGDIDLACENNGTLSLSQCYPGGLTVSYNSGVYGVASTDNVTAATVLWGGTGYTTAPTCTIAGPSNNNPYTSSANGTLWAGGTQAHCTASVSASTTNSVWSIVVESTSAATDVLYITNVPLGGSVTCGPYTLAGSSTKNIASALGTAIGTGCSLASEAVSSSTVTLTGKTTGAAGNYIVEYGPPTTGGTGGNIFDTYLSITNTTKGQGPNYVSGITITTAGSGYAPETPITLGGPGTGAVAVANTSPGTAAQSYQPAYGAAPGWDMATGLGSVNAYNMVNNCAWTNTCIQAQTITVTQAPPASAAYNSTFNVSATASSSLPVAITTSGSCSGSGTSSATITITSGSGTCSTIFNQAGNGSYSAAPTITDNTNATTASQTITVTQAPPASAAYGSSFNVSATASSSLAVAIIAAGPCSGSGSGSATITMNSATGVCSVFFNQAGNGNYSAAPQVTDTTNATAASTSISVTSVSPSSESFGQDAPVTITAVLSWSGSGSAPTAADVTIGGNGPSTYGATSCGSPSGNTLTCTATYTPTTNDANGNYTETGSFSGDSNYSSSTSSQTNNFSIGTETTTTGVACTPNPSTYGSSVTCTATVNTQNGDVKGRHTRVKSLQATGNVTWSANTGCSASALSGDPGTATCNTSVLPQGTDTVTATYAGDSNHNGSSGNTSEQVNPGTLAINVTSVSPSSEDYAADVTATITATLSWTGGNTPTAADVTIGGNGPSSYGTTSCGAPSGNTMTCTNTYTPTPSDTPGTYTETASFSGDGNYGAVSSSQTNNFTINNATTTTSVVSGTNPSTYGQPVTFTATITAENGFVKGRVRGKVKSNDLTGTVAWSANTGCGTTNVTGGTGGNPATATCTTSSLAVGSHHVVATYSGDSEHGGSSGHLSSPQVVNQATTSIDVTNVTPSSESFAQDAPVTITAVLTWSGTGTAPTAANVNIVGNGNGTYGTTSCGTPSGTTLTCTNSYTPSNADVAGSYTETASFSGDTNYTSSNSPETNNFTIGAETTTTGVVCTPTPSTYGTSVTCTATVNTQNGDVRGRAGRRGRAVSRQATGTVTWSGNTGCSASTLSGDPGTATCTTSSLNAGSDTVMATYAGDSDHSGSSGSTNQTVTQASQTINVTFIPTTATLKSSFTVAASASSGLSLAYTSSGGCTNAGATYTMAMTGHVACDVIINQAGNSNYTAAPQFSQNVTVAAAVVPTKSLTGPSSAFYGSTYNVTPTSDSFSVPTLVATPATVCTISGTTVSMINGTGSCTVKATWAANYEYAAATATLVTHAEKVPSTVNWSNPAAITYGTPLSGTQLNATATDPNNNVIPGAFVYTPAAGTILAAGTHTLKVKFTPTANTDYTTVAATDVTIVVNPVGTTTAITSSSANPSTVNETVTFDFTVTQANSAPVAAMGTVTLTASTGETCHGALASGAGHCNIKFTTSGARTITASYAGNVNNQASTSAPFTQTVN